MHRTQLLLEDWQYQALKSTADRQGTSISQLVRDILTRHLRARRSEAGRLRRIQGIAADGTSAARDHDAYLYGKKRRR
jgi:predicted DNA-binding ribbon-helix-helix protein